MSVFSTDKSRRAICVVDRRFFFLSQPHFIHALIISLILTETNLEIRTFVF